MSHELSTACLRIAALVAVVSCPALAETAAPLSLSQAVHTALTQNPQVLAARANQVAATARIGQARAPWLPQASATTQLRGDYSYQTGQLPPTGSAEAGSAGYRSAVTASQLIYDFGRLSAQIRSALAAARASLGDENAVRNQIALAVATAFVAVLQAEALKDVTAKNLAQQEQRFRQAESFFTIGTRPEIDVLIAKTAQAQAQLQLVQAENRIRLTRVQLTQVLGVSDDSYLQRPLMEVPDLSFAEEGQQVDALLQEALALRPEYLALRERLIQAQAQLGVAYGGYYPQLSLSATADLSGVFAGLAQGEQAGTRQPIVTSGDPRLSVAGGLTLSWPFLSGLSTVYSVRETRALVLAAQANVLSFQQRLRSDLQQALFTVGEAKQSLQAAQTVLFQAERQLAMATGRYETGVGNMIELGDAQVAATTARAQKVQADYALAMARVGLRTQLGKLIETFVPSGRAP